MYVYLFICVFAVGVGCESISSAKAGDRSTVEQREAGERKVANYTNGAILGDVTKTIIVRTPYPTYNFTLFYDQNQVAVKGYDFDLSLQRRECNGYLIDQFNRDIEKWIKIHIGKSILKNRVGKVNISTSINGQKYFVSFESEAGGVLLSIPKEVLRMKQEETLSCEKKDKAQA